MAGGKETPRQKMIGMMYLVLTALLALNVSKSILDAFVTINNGLETTKITFDGKLDATYAAFENSYNENKAKYGEAWQKAQELKKSADALVHHLDLIKAKTIAETEGLSMEDVIAPGPEGVDTVLGLQYVNGRDNYDANTHLMIGSEPANPKTDDHPDGNNYRAAVLKQQLHAYGEELSGMIKNNPELAQSIDSLFSYPEEMKDASGTKTNWESLNFYHVPLAATTTILSKLQSDIRNAESDALNNLFAGVEAASFKFTGLREVVVPKKTYILEGDTFKAEVFLAAYDETKPPTVILAPSDAKVVDGEIVGGEGKELPTQNGKGIVSIPATSIGEKHWEGIIKFKGPEGVKTYPFNVEYEVAKPSAVVSPIKMNVLYRGIENPIAISAPGISADDLRPQIDNGTLVRQPDGTYIVKNLKSGTKATVTVMAEMDGKTKRIGAFDFRVKSVPDPVASFAGRTAVDNTVPAAQLKAALGVAAELKDFEFDLKYPITSFDIVTIIGGEAKTLPSNSAYLTADQKELLQQLRRNQVVIVESIKAKAPDGTIRKLASITLKVI